MVKTSTLVLGAVGVAGIAAGFGIDRAMADMPSRVDGRVPDIAKPWGQDQDSYYWKEPPKKDGWFVNPALIWGSALLAVGAGLGTIAVRSAIPVDRVWHATPLGMAAIGTALAGAGIAIGSSASRIALG
jgi:hypothetical protein